MKTGNGEQVSSREVRNEQVLSWRGPPPGSPTDAQAGAISQVKRSGASKQAGRFSLETVYFAGYAGRLAGGADALWLRGRRRGARIPAGVLEFGTFAHVCCAGIGRARSWCRFGMKSAAGERVESQDA